MQSLKILVSAYVCELHSSSEAEVGWQWVNRLSKYHNIVVISKRPYSIQNVKRLIKGNQNLRFEYYDLPKFFNFMRTGDIRHFIYYNLWQIGAFFHARKLVKKEKFDLVHHLVYVNTWQPTYMAFLKVPFIFGPIGENPKIPSSIVRHYGVRIILREALGSFIKYIGKNLNPIMRAIYNKANKIIVINDYVYSTFRPQIRKKTFIHPAIGVSRIVEHSSSNIEIKKKTFMVLYVGRFVYLKGPDLALKAFLKFAEKNDDVELIMIGGGKMENSLKEICKKSINGHKVTFMGWIDRKEVFGYMNSCDVFLFPTFEGGGMVILEAMSFGKPVICLDYGGPKDFVTEECGIKVPVTNIPKIISGLVEALNKIYTYQDLRRAMGIAAKERVEDYYIWDKKAEWMSRIYFNSLDI